MTRSARAALAAALLLACGSAAAINEMFAKNAPITRMNDEDFRIAGEVMRKALDEGPDGQSYAWKNPKTAAHGSITPLAAFERDGMQCRGMKYQLTAGGQSSTTQWNLCKTAAGWKVAEGR